MLFLDRHIVYNEHDEKHNNINHSRMASTRAGAVHCFKDI